MEPLRVLITNYALVGDAGTERYVLDLARQLLRLGHRPVVHSSQLGPVAERLRLATVPVVDDLAVLGDWVPDVLHCQHTLETILALLHFPGTPAIYICHDWSYWLDQGPPLERVVRYVAVDETVRDRLELVHGVPGERIRIVPNWVDLTRFRPRGPLPSQPARALILSNYASPGSHLEPVREACERLGIPLDVVGRGVGNPTDRPEDLLPHYDLVFAKAKAALEAMAVGAAVVVCDARGLGPMVTGAEFDRLRRLNFGARSLQGRLDPEDVMAEVKRYDPADAALVSERVRAEAGLDAAADQLVEVYRDAIAEGARLTPDPVAEGRVLATFLRPVSERLRVGEETAWKLQVVEAERDAWDAERRRLDVERVEFLQERDRVQAEVDRLQGELDRAGVERSDERERHGVDLERTRGESDACRRELDAVLATATFRLRERFLAIPGVRRVVRALVAVRK